MPFILDDPVEEAMQEIPSYGRSDSSRTLSLEPDSDDDSWVTAQEIAETDDPFFASDFLTSNETVSDDEDEVAERATRSTNSGRSSTETLRPDSPNNTFPTAREIAEIENTSPTGGLLGVFRPARTEQAGQGVRPSGSPIPFRTTALESDIQNNQFPTRHDIGEIENPSLTSPLLGRSRITRDDQARQGRRRSASPILSRTAALEQDSKDEPLPTRRDIGEIENPFPTSNFVGAYGSTSVDETGQEVGSWVSPSRFSTAAFELAIANDPFLTRREIEEIENLFPPSDIFRPFTPTSVDETGQEVGGSVSPSPLSTATFLSGIQNEFVSWDMPENQVHFPMGGAHQTIRTGDGNQTSEGAHQTSRHHRRVHRCQPRQNAESVQRETRQQDRTAAPGVVDVFGTQFRNDFDIAFENNFGVDLGHDFNAGRDGGYQDEFEWLTTRNAPAPNEGQEEHDFSNFPFDFSCFIPTSATLTYIPDQEGIMMPVPVDHEFPYIESLGALGMRPANDTTQYHTSASTFATGNPVTGARSNVPNAPSSNPAALVVDRQGRQFTAEELERQARRRR